MLVRVWVGDDDACGCIMMMLFLTMASNASAIDLPSTLRVFVDLNGTLVAVHEAHQGWKV